MNLKHFSTLIGDSVPLVILQIDVLEMHSHQYKHGNGLSNINDFNFIFFFWQVTPAYIICANRKHKAHTSYIHSYCTTVWFRLLTVVQSVPTANCRISHMCFLCRFFQILSASLEMENEMYAMPTSGLEKKKHSNMRTVKCVNVKSEWPSQALLIVPFTVIIKS